MTWLPRYALGDRVGALTIISREGRSKNGSALWLAQCDCGKTCSVSSDRLSNVRSCGCLPLAPRPSGHKPRIGFPSQQELWQRLAYDPLTGIFRWKVMSKGRRLTGEIAGGQDGNGYIQISLDRVAYKAHHLAWIYVHGEMHSLPQTDHRDRIRSNNAIINLRPCSNAENQANQRKRNTTGLPKGIRRSGESFSARINVQKQPVHLGSFSTVEEASNAYLTAAKKFYGEFASNE